MSAHKTLEAGPNRTETLLVLKAIILGRNLPSRSPLVRGKIQTGIDLTMTQTGTAAWHRQLFYRLLQAENCRSEPSCIGLRRAGKELSGKSGIFEVYMRAHGATKPRKSLHGIQHCVIAVASNLDMNLAETIMEEVGISEDDLSNSNARFLYDVTLEELLVKHGITD